MAMISYGRTRHYRVMTVRHGKSATGASGYMKVRPGPSCSKHLKFNLTFNIVNINDLNTFIFYMSKNNNNISSFNI